MKSLRDLESGELEAFALTAPRGVDNPSTLLGVPLRVIDANDFGEGMRTGVLLNTINGLVFGGLMGMPHWVMADLGVLPAAYVGVLGPARAVPPKHRAKIDEVLALRRAELERPGPEDDGEYQRRLSGAIASEVWAEALRPLRDEDQVPLAEWGFIASVRRGEVLGYSLDSLVKGLGTVAKSLGLDYVSTVLAATHQVGVAQFGNDVLRTHSRFGDLEILHAITPLHSKPDHTFVYRCEIPDHETLTAIARRERSGVHPDLAESEHELIGDRDGDRISALHDDVRSGAKAYVARPGSVPTPGSTRDDERSAVISRAARGKEVDT